MSHHDHTSSSLLESLRVHDDRAWERFVSVYGPTLYRWCRSARLYDEDTADVIQETFRAVARSIGRFQREHGQHGSFTAWLWRVTQSKIQNHRQRAAKRELAKGGSDAQALMSELSDPYASDCSMPGSGNDQSIVMCAAETIRAEFKDSTWQAFWRVAIDDQPTDMVAAQLDISVAAVRQANYRVRRRLRQELDFMPEFGGTNS